MQLTICHVLGLNYFAMPMPCPCLHGPRTPPCQTHAAPMRDPCLIVTHNVTQCDTHARPMLSPCQTHARPMHNHARPMPGPCATHARPMPCPCSRVYPARYIITREFELRDAPQRKKDSRSRISRLVGRLKLRLRTSKNIDYNPHLTT